MSNLLVKLISMKYKGRGNIRKYIMNMSNLTTKLKLDQNFILHLVLIFLPAHYGQFKVSYYSHKCDYASFLWSRPPSKDKRFIFVGDDNKVAVEAIGTFILQLKTRYYLDLFETFVVSSFRRNLISISILDKFGFSCFFGNNKVSLYQNSNIVRSDSLIDNLYMLDVVSSHNEILQIGSQGTKRKLIENSVILQHKCLSHISKQRIQRLVSDEIIEPLDLSNFKVWKTNIRKLGAERAKDVLELIHTNICGPFPTVSWNGQQYFITFINDYSKCGYLYLVHEKSQSLDIFKSFKAKKIKVVEFDCGGEYYGRYDGSREQCPRPFAFFLKKECEIVSQYTMPDKPSMNSVAER
ncbi:hypothetical protein CR513_32196, partial [Mucuna pruriens]